MKSSTTFRADWRAALLLVFVGGSLALLMSMAPIPQDLGYHVFADSRRLFGIPNALDVISNTAFLLVGARGLYVVSRMPVGLTTVAWKVFAFGIFLVGLGSAYYHLAPDNSSLVWDRLPMTIGFMGLFTALVSEYTDGRLAKILLIPAIVVGAASVLYWHWMDDLRFYAWVQFMPLGVVALVLVLYRARYTHSWLLAVGLGFYAAAKVFEFYDVAVFEFFNNVVSGHTIKHLSAAAGCYALVVSLQFRAVKEQY